MENKQKSIHEYLKQSANAITKENAKTEVAIIPKFLKAGITKDKRLKPMDINVLYALYEYVNTDTGHCYPSQTELAEILGYARPNISKALTRLEKAGYIHRCPAKKPTKNGKFTETADEIIITPYSKLKDNEYHSSLIAEIARIRYIVVDYTKDSSVRTIIATGENTESHTKQEMTEIRETNRQKAETEPTTIINIQKEKTEKMYKYIPSKAEDAAFEALRKQETLEIKYHNTKSYQRAQEPQQQYYNATDEEILAAFAEYDSQQRQQQPKPQPKKQEQPKEQQQTDDYTWMDAWLNQPYTFSGKGA